jgi:predicted  nucleic acid-binding Zn-ribbon protein
MAEPTVLVKIRTEADMKGLQQTLQATKDLARAQGLAAGEFLKGNAAVGKTTTGLRAMRDSMRGLAYQIPLIGPLVERIFTPWGLVMTGVSASIGYTVKELQKVKVMMETTQPEVVKLTQSFKELFDLQRQAKQFADEIAGLGQDTPLQEAQKLAGKTDDPRLKQRILASAAGAMAAESGYMQSRMPALQQQIQGSIGQEDQTRNDIAQTQALLKAAEADAERYKVAGISPRHTTPIQARVKTFKSHLGRLQEKLAARQAQTASLRGEYEGMQKRIVTARGMQETAANEANAAVPQSQYGPLANQAGAQESIAVKSDYGTAMVSLNGAAGSIAAGASAIERAAKSFEARMKQIEETARGSRMGR